MILENYTPDVADQELHASPEFIGEGFEFTELSVSAISEMHNLTIALARVEHKCLVESNDALLEAGVKEFFAKIVETIKKWWNTFIGWLGSMWNKLKDVFVKREDWLKRNSAAISGATDEQLKGMTANLGAEVGSVDYSAIAAKAIGEAKSVVGLATHLNKDAVADSRSFTEKAKEMLLSPLKSRDTKKSIAKNIYDSLVGESGEVTVTKGLVGTLVKTAFSTFKAIDQLKGAKMVADAAMKEAEGLVKVEGGDKEIVNARVSYLRSMGPEIQGLIAGFASAVSAANGQVMPILVKVAAAAGKTEKKADEAAAPAKDEKKDSVNASTDILAAFM